MSAEISLINMFSTVACLVLLHFELLVGIHAVLKVKVFALLN